MDLLTDTFSRHDKYQLETIFTYPLDPSLPCNEYQVDTYIFVPENFGISRETYSREQFYCDSRKYIRLKTPVMKLPRVMGGVDSPMAKLERALTRMANADEPALRKTYSDRLKMFCSIMKSTLRDETIRLEHSLAEDDFPNLVERYLEESGDIFRKFRTLLKLLPDQPAFEPERKLFCYADEFLSLTADKYHCRLWALLDRCGCDLPRGGKLKDKLWRAVSEETSYRAARRYPSVPKAEGENEELLYRESTLKKVIAGVLFLRTSRRRDGVLLENLAFGLAAGVAMAFATAVAFAWKILLLEEFSLAFFAIWVVAYMGKDRIKELLRYYLQSKIRRFMADYRTTITTALGNEIGICRESVAFVSENGIDPEVKRLRNRTHLGDLENEGYQEQVLLARKHVRLKSRADDPIFFDFNVNGVVDIMRFNVRRFLEKMDNPFKEIQIAEPGHKIVSRRAKRVYHLNIVVKYGMVGQPNRYRRFRLVLARNGIRRIENVTE